MITIMDSVTLVVIKIVVSNLLIIIL